METRHCRSIMATALQNLRRICPIQLLTAQLGYGFRYTSSSHHLRGLEEFFPAGVYESGGPGPKEVKTGRRWHAADLRQKSNNDLHKLWYVLLKEMNMLQTVKAEAKRLEMPMPNPERIKKVQRSMAMIKVVIGEREKAVEKLAEIGYSSMQQAETTLELDSGEGNNGSHLGEDITSKQNLVDDHSEEKTEQVDKNKTLIT